MSWRIIDGDCRTALASLPAASAHTCVTSPPHGRSFVGIELNAEYAQLARDRIVADCPLWNTGLEVDESLGTATLGEVA